MITSHPSEPIPDPANLQLIDRGAEEVLWIPDPTNSYGLLIVTSNCTQKAQHLAIISGSVAETYFVRV